MEINKIQIGSFGKFKNFEMCFDKNMQIIYGENEAGKSTIMEFIKIMLYSRRNGDTTGKDDKILRAKYTPWIGDKEMYGAIEFTHNSTDYKLQKKIDLNSVSKDITDLLNISSGEIINFKKKQEVGEYLFDIDVKSFERTGYIKNLGDEGFEQSKSNIDTLTEKIINFSLTGSEELSINTIISRLENAIKNLTRNKNKSGKIPETKQEISDLSEKIYNLNRLESEQAEILDKINNIKKMQAEKSYLKTKLETIERDREITLIKDLISIKKQNIEINSRLNIPEHNIIEKLYNAKENIKFHENKILEQKIDNFCSKNREIVEDITNQRKALENSINHKKKFLMSINFTVLSLTLFLFFISFFVTKFSIVTNILAFITGILGIFHYKKYINYMKNNKNELSKLQEQIDNIESEIMCRFKTQTQIIVQNTKIIDKYKEEFVNILSNYGNISNYDHALDFFDTIMINSQKIEKNNEKIENYEKILCIKYKNIHELEKLVEQHEFSDFSVTNEEIFEIKNRLEQLESMNLDNLYIENHKKITKNNENIDNLNSNLVNQKKYLEKLENYLKSLEIAKEVFCECLDSIRRTFSPDLNNHASEILKNITSAKYNKLYVQKDYKIIINNDFFDRTYENFSSGTIDQAYLALRIAISKLISSEIPLILDDVLVRYDTNRIINTLSFLKKTSKNTQIILFTCHDYIVNCAEKLGIKIINI